MWAINNQTRFKADRAFVRDTEGAEIWVVAVRATFSITGDEHVEIAEEQQDVRLAPQYFGEPGRSSLCYDMDLVRMKPGTDVIIHANAHAPGRQPVPFVDVGWWVGPLVKRLRIVGDRTWEKGLFGFSTSEPQPYIEMPISYERALGGLLTDEKNGARDPQNPVGVGRMQQSGQPVPNCEYPGEPIRHPKAKIRPAGFGPIPCEWQPRTKLAGTYNDAWQKERQPLVPRDFQDTYFQCAPVDQQVNGFLQGGEEVVLHNLSPEGVLRFKLPRVRLGFSTRINSGTTHHRGQLHTLIIEPEERRLVMVWQTALPCHHTLYTLKETTIIEKKSLTLGVQTESEVELAV